MRPSERLAWLADVVAPGPAERVLEVGCGHGVLVGLLADRAREVVGVDRSPTMITAASRRNRAAIDAGRVRLLAAALTDADLDGLRFDVVVSFNVRAFWTRPAVEWDVVRVALAPGGTGVRRLLAHGRRAGDAGTGRGRAARGTPGVHPRCGASWTHRADGIRRAGAPAPLTDGWPHPWGENRCSSSAQAAPSVCRSPGQVTE